jgi:hypothetical protein
MVIREWDAEENIWAQEGRRNGSGENYVLAAY